MTTKHVIEEPLQVYEDRKQAEAALPRYARLCKSYGLVPAFRVKAAPMQRGRYQGSWGVWLVRHS